MTIHTSRWSHLALVVSALLLATAADAGLMGLWGVRHPFITYFPAVMFAAYLAGWMFGAVTTVLSTTLVAVLFLAHPIDRIGVAALACFVGASSVVLVLSERLRRDRRAAERAAVNARGREERLRASEQEFRCLFETASVGHALADAVTGRFLRVNRTLCELTGYTPDELLRMTFYDLTHRDDRDANRRTFEQFVEEGGPAYRIEKRYVRKNGRMIWVKVEAFVVRDALGRPVRTGAVIEDVTEARAATAVLARSREELHAVLDAAPVAIWIAHDPECRLLTQNQVAAALLGSNGHDLACRTLLRRAVASGEAIRDVEIEATRANGDPITLLGGAVPLRDPDGTVRGSVMACVDVTARRDAAETLRQREYELRLALKAGRMASVVWNVVTNEATWSEEYFGLLGLPPHAITPTYAAWRARVHPDDLPRVEEELQRAMSRHHDLVVEYRNVWDDGTIKWVEGRGHFDYDAEGRPVRMVGILLDVEERKAAEQERERAALALERIQRITDAMIGDLGLETLLREVLSRVLNAVETDTASILVRDRNGHDEQQVTVAAGTDDHEHQEDIRIPLGAGFAGKVAAERRPIIWDHVDLGHLASPLLERMGVRTVAGVPLTSGEELLGVLHVGSIRPRAFGADDVNLLQLAADRIALGIERSARRDAERRAREIAENANRAKDQFLAMLGHELRNPIAAIRNAVVTTPLDESDRERAVGIVRRQSKRLSRLVDDLLDVARVAQGKITLHLGRVDVGAIVEHALEATRALIDERRHAVAVSLADAVDVQGDSDRLEQVIGNLLANAAKYTDPGGRIAVSVAREGSEAVVRVRDTGVGIAADALPAIFDLFMQAHHGTGHESRGLGVGLTIARRLVELHGGRIDARSDGPGRGSEFIVRLPALPCTVPALSPPAVHPVSRRARVLVVEDNVDVADALGMLLRRIGAEVEIVRDGPSAIAAVRAAMPEMALVDIGLPEMDGYQVATRIRELPGGRDVVLVALTGYGNVGDRERALSSGFDAHQTKPVELDALRALLHGLHGRGHGDGTYTVH